MAGASLNRSEKSPEDGASVKVKGCPLSSPAVPEMLAAIPAGIALILVAQATVCLALSSATL